MVRTDETVVGAAETMRSRSNARPRIGWAAAGSVLGAISASSCCILPLVLFGLGSSGVWIGNLTALAPYQPIFIAVTLAFLGYGFHAVYRKPRKACANDGECTRPLPSLAVKTAFWVSALLVAAAVAFPYVAPTLLGV